MILVEVLYATKHVLPSSTMHRSLFLEYRTAPIQLYKRLLITSFNVCGRSDQRVRSFQP